MKTKAILTIPILGGGHAALCLCGSLGPARPTQREALADVVFTTGWHPEHGCPSCE